MSDDLSSLIRDLSLALIALAPLEALPHVRPLILRAERALTRPAPRQIGTQCAHPCDRCGEPREIRPGPCVTCEVTERGLTIPPELLKPLPKLLSPIAAPPLQRPTRRSSSSSSAPSEPRRRSSSAPTRFGAGACPSCRTRNVSLFSTAAGVSCRDCLEELTDE